MTDETAVVRKPGMVISPRTAEFWKAADRGELLLQRCAGCGHVQHYARSICTSCWSHDLSWQRSAGLGAVWTFTVIGVPGHPAWRREVPYVVAVVELDEGPRVLTNIVGVDPEAVAIGQRVRLTPTRDTDTGQTLLTFGEDLTGEQTLTGDEARTGAEAGETR